MIQCAVCGNVMKSHYNLETMSVTIVPTCTRKCMEIACNVIKVGEEKGYLSIEPSPFDSLLRESDSIILDDPYPEIDLLEKNLEKARKRHMTWLILQSQRKKET